MTRRDRRRLALLAAVALAPILAVGVAVVSRGLDRQPPAVASTQQRLESDGYQIVFNLWERKAIPDQPQGMTVRTPADADGVRYTVHALRAAGESRITLRGRVSTAGDDVPPMFEAMYSANGQPSRIADGCDRPELARTRAACDRVAAIILDAKPTT